MKQDAWLDKIVPQYPFYCNPVLKNKLIRYEVRLFNDGYGNKHCGRVRVAIYEDKKGQIKEADAQVMWYKDVWNLNLQRFVPLRPWMRYNPDHVTSVLKFTEEDWKNLSYSFGIGQK